MRRLTLISIMVLIAAAVVTGTQILNASATSPTPVEPFSGVVVPSGPELSLESIEEIAWARAEQAGDPTPSMSVAKGTFEDAMRSIDPSTNFPETSAGIRKMLAAPVTLVVMHGNFTLKDARVRRGDPAPTGSVLDLIIDSHTGDVVGRALPRQQETGGLPLASVASAGVAHTGTLIGRLSVAGGPHRHRGGKLNPAAKHRPVGPTVLITGPRFAKKTTTSGDGTFHVRLRPGRYLVRGLVGGFCPAVGVVVRGRETTRAKVFCSIR